MKLRKFWTGFVTVVGVIGTIVAVISLGQTYGWFLPSDPKPTKGLKRVSADELSWLNGRWCGSTQATLGNVIVFAPNTKQVFGRRYAPLDMPQGGTLPGSEEFYTDAKLYRSGSQSIVIDFLDGRFEMWSVTHGPVLQTSDLVQDLVFPT